MSTTPNLGLTLPAQGSSSWDAPLNGNFTKLDVLGGGTTGQVLTSNGPNSVPTFQAASGSSPIQIATVTLTAAQLKSLHASPIQITAAPGAGKALLFQAAWLQYKAGAIPFTLPAGGALRLYYTALGSGNSLDGQNAVGFLDQAVSMVVPLANQGLNVAIQSSVENQPILINNDNATEWTAGDGTLTVTMYYSIVTLT